VADPVSQADTDADLVPLAENAMASEESMQRLLVLETAKAEERGRSKGFELGLASGREETLGQLQAERDRLHAQASALIESFAVARESYFHRLEQEGVQLALAIAARILRREAQMDPLLLTGAVRVALRQLADSTEVRLTVPLEDHALWEEALARMPGLVLRPQVLGDAHMQLGDCRMETELGSANLGLWAQLKEIERGFFVRAESSGQVSMEQRSGFSSYEPAPGEAEAADGAYGTAFSPARFASAGNAEERQNG
jgi:flagellar biosynthesis/type III secretory pathway protein FliH